MKNFGVLLLAIFCMTGLFSQTGSTKEIRQKGLAVFVEVTGNRGIDFIPEVGERQIYLNRNGSLKGTIGYQFNPNIAIGPSLTTDIYPLRGQNFEYGIEVRTALNRKRFAPTINLFAGSHKGRYYSGGGYVINPTIGFKKYLNRRIALNLNAGVKWTKVNLDDFRGYFITEPTYSPSGVYRHFTISAGFSF